MGVRFPSVWSTTALNPTGTGGEIIVCTTPFLTLPIDSAAVIILWTLSYTNGATAIAPVINIRRGPTTTSALVQGTGTIGAPAASSGAEYSGAFIDPSTGASAPQYSIGFNNSNSGTSVAFSNMSLIAFAL